MTRTMAETAKPTLPSIIFFARAPIVPSSNAVSMVDVRVSMETQAEAKLMDLEAEKTGLLYFLYLTTFTIAIVKDVNVYAAMVIAVII